MRELNRNTNYWGKFSLLLWSGFWLCAQAVTAEMAPQLASGQWSNQRANAWYAAQPWLVGCNFLPSTAVNDIEMWQTESFDIGTIERELGWARDLGFNTVRVFLNYVVWEADAKGLKQRLDRFLTIADQLGIRMMPVLFDDCNFAGRVAAAGRQPDPVPGVHNSQWVSSPPLHMVTNRSAWPSLERYVKDLIGTYATDRRVIIWDLYNEPGNSNMDTKSQPLMEASFAWAREMNPQQPLTIGAWANFDTPFSRRMMALSDVVSFHGYDDRAGIEAKLKKCAEYGRPVLCTEWLRRQTGNTFETLLPLFHERRIGCYNWGLVAGRTQTYFPWGSPPGATEPKQWQHDIFRADGTPFAIQEVATIRSITGAGKTPSQPSSQRPIPRKSTGGRSNIIFLLTDDQRDNTLSAMGHPFVKTPHLDRFLRSAVRFRNTYIASPVCSPSRVSYFTGMLERVHGVGFSSAYDLTEAQWERSYPALLRRSGYHTGFIGKFGVEYYTFKGRAPEKFDFWWGHDGWTRFFPKDASTPSTIPYHHAKEDIITFIMGEAMTKFLDSLPGDKPFCLSVSFNVPHGSQTTSMYPDYPGWHSMTRPANENPKLKGHPFYDTLYRDIDIAIPEDTATDPYRFIPKFILDQNQGRSNETYPYNYDRATCREHHIRYYQTITGLDQVIGNLLAELERRGLAQNTVVLFGSDHGLLMGEYGMGGKSLLYDLSAKIPCLVHDPRLPAEMKGRQLDQLVSSLDLTRTILDYAGVAPAEFMDGQSLRPLVEGKRVPWREELFLESLFTLRDNPFQEGIRTKRWKYIRMYNGVLNFSERDVNFVNRQPEFEQLFDLETDLEERHNLANRPEHAALLVDLRQKVAQHSLAINQQREAFKQIVPPHPRALPPKSK